MTKCIALCALAGLAILLSIGIMMYGWGLEPRSWWWIIGGGVAGRTLLVMVERVAKEEDRE